MGIFWGALCQGQRGVGNQTLPLLADSVVRATNTSSFPHPAFTTSPALFPLNVVYLSYCKQIILSPLFIGTGLMSSLRVVQQFDDGNQPFSVAHPL